MSRARDVNVFATPDALADAAATLIVDTAQKSIAASGRFVIALSGGSTPRPVYERLAREQHASAVEWDRVHWCWSDERCVPPDDRASNYHMANEAMLAHLPMRAASVHRMRGELPPSDAALEYEHELRALFATPDEKRLHGDHLTVVEPHFDLVLLGMGADGHTASLFPRDRALDEQERWTASVQRPDYSRVTLTLPAINAAADVLFLVTGKDKANVLRDVFNAEHPSKALPASCIRPVRGVVHWFVDSAAGELAGQG